MQPFIFQKWKKFGISVRESLLVDYWKSLWSNKASSTPPETKIKISGSPALQTDTCTPTGWMIHFYSNQSHHISWSNTRGMALFTSCLLYPRNLEVTRFSIMWQSTVHKKTKHVLLVLSWENTWKSQVSWGLLALLLMSSMTGWVTQPFWAMASLSQERIKIPCLIWHG